MSNSCREHRWSFIKPKAAGFFSKRDDNQTNDIQPFVGELYQCLDCLSLEMEVYGNHQRVQVNVASKEEGQRFWVIVERRINESSQRECA